MERSFQTSKRFHKLVFPSESTIKCSVHEFDYILTKQVERRTNCGGWIYRQHTKVFRCLCCCLNLNILNRPIAKHLTDRDFEADTVPSFHSLM